MAEEGKLLFRSSLCPWSCHSSLRLGTGLGVVVSGRFVIH